MLKIKNCMIQDAIFKNNAISIMQFCYICAG